jgi:hypothetical protein
MHLLDSGRSQTVAEPKVTAVGNKGPSFFPLLAEERQAERGFPSSSSREEEECHRLSLSFPPFPLLLALSSMST